MQTLSISLFHCHDFFLFFPGLLGARKWRFLTSAALCDQLVRRGKGGSRPGLHTKRGQGWHGKRALLITSSYSLDHTHAARRKKVWKCSSMCEDFFFFRKSSYAFFLSPSLPAGQNRACKALKSVTSTALKTEAAIQKTIWTTIKGFTAFFRHSLRVSKSLGQIAMMQENLFFFFLYQSNPERTGAGEWSVQYTVMIHPGWGDSDGNKALVQTKETKALTCKWTVTLFFLSQIWEDFLIWNLYSLLFADLNLLGETLREYHVSSLKHTKKRSSIFKRFTADFSSSFSFRQIKRKLHSRRPLQGHKNNYLITFGPLRGRLFGPDSGRFSF